MRCSNIKIYSIQYLEHSNNKEERQNMILSNEEKKIALEKLNKFLDEYKECFIENPVLYAHIATTFMYGLETGKMSDILRSICEELGYSSFLAIDEYGIFFEAYESRHWNR